MFCPFSLINLVGVEGPVCLKWRVATRSCWPTKWLKMGRAAWSFDHLIIISLTCAGQTAPPPMHIRDPEWGYGMFRRSNRITAGDRMWIQIPTEAPPLNSQVEMNTTSATVVWTVIGECLTERIASDRRAWSDCVWDSFHGAGSTYPRWISRTSNLLDNNNLMIGGF